MAKSYVLMNCELGSEKEVISSLKKIGGVKEAHGILGLYDIIVQVELDSEKNIQKLITETIRKISKIRSTMTLTRSESGKLFHTSEKIIGVMLGQNTSQAYVIIHCNKGDEFPVLKNLSKILEVKEADVVFGLYDIICKIEAADNKTLDNILTKTIRVLPHIKTSMTLHIVKEQE